MVNPGRRGPGKATMRRARAGGRLAGATSAARAVGPVLTHGEPHPANLLSAGGSLLLIDWDTVGLAPPERDLSLIIGEAGEARTGITQWLAGR
jgi:spectinomycin phosphotransferase